MLRIGGGRAQLGFGRFPFSSLFPVSVEMFPRGLGIATYTAFSEF